MKKLLVFALSIISAASITFTSFAGWQQDGDRWKYLNSDDSRKTGWFYDVSLSAWYYFDEQGYMVSDSWIEDGGNQYYLSEDGRMLTNAVAPGGIYVGKDGAATEVTYNKHYDNVKEDTISFISNGEVITIPCKIYYNNERVGTYTTVRYDSVGMEAFNGEKPNMIITYTVLRTGVYNGTYMGCDMYVNGTKERTLGGKNGNLHIKFNKDYLVIEIPYDTLKKDDFVEIYINQ